MWSRCEVEVGNGGRDGRWGRVRWSRGALPSHWRRRDSDAMRQSLFFLLVRGCLTIGVGVKLVGGLLDGLGFEG